MKPRILAACLACLAIQFPTIAQTVTATVTGIVSDPAQAAVPGASVSAINNATNIARTARTNAAGVYTLTNLPPGHYKVTAQRSGFRQAVVPDVELLVNQTAHLDLRLQIGQVTESVLVEAAAPVVASETSSVANAVDPHQMLNLPLKGRNFYDLAQLAPGVTSQMPGSFVASHRPTPGGLNAPAFYVAGGRETSNGYLIDGVDAVDPHYLTPSMFPPVDAIQEFQLLTSSYSAEFGRFSAQVNATTRSGGNDFHGTLYEFLRNDTLNATNFFGNATGVGQAPLRYNQFGGTLGGPVWAPHLYNGRNRTFFFFSYEGTRVRQGKTSQASVPSPAQRGGDFSQLGFRNNLPLFDPSTTRPNPAGSGFVRDPFPGNIIPSARITPFAQTVMNFYPLPVSSAATGNNFFESLSDLSDNDQVLFRIDHRFGDKDSVFFRYDMFTGPQSSRSPIEDTGSTTNVRNKNLAFNYVHLFTADTLNELRSGYNRPTYLILQDGAYQNDFATKLGLQNLLSDPIVWGVPQVNVTGFSGIGSDANPTTQVSNVYQLIDHVTLIRGKHSLKLGGEARKTNYNDRSERFDRGSFGFTGAMTANPQSRSNTGYGLADLLLGLPLTASGSSTSLAGNFNGFTYAAFVQDDWKVSPRLTLNLGLRYDVDTRFSDVQNRLTYFDGAYPGGRLLIAGTSSAYIPGTGVTSGPATSRTLIPADKNNWGPRIGLAFRPFGGDRTAIRAGYGVFYSVIELQDLRTWVRNPPFGSVVQLTADQNENSSSAGALRVSDLFPAQGTPAALPAAYSAAGNYPTPYYQQWNFTVQHELGKRTLVELGYLGSKGTRLVQRLNANQAIPDANPAKPTPLAGRIPYPLFGNTIRVSNNEANSTYHALIAKLERRYANGFSFLASYTFAKSLDGASLIDDGPRDIHNLRLQKGRSEFDIRQHAVLSGTWELPFGRGKRHLTSGFLSYVAGGWQANSILSLRTGFPFSVGVSGDVCNCNAGSQLAQQVGDPLTGFTQSIAEWFNVAAFAKPVSGTFGSSGRDILSGPSSVNVDFSLFRNIPLPERFSLQFRAEAFNLFNHANFGQPGATVGTPSYGIVQSASDARTVQFALKLRF